MPRIDWDESIINLTPAQRREVESQVENGASIEAIREVVTRKLRELDPNFAARAVHSPLQIDIRAVGGLRPGSLQGGSWIARRAASTWLCRCLRIFLRASDDYFTVRAFNEEYIWHLPILDERDCAQVRLIKDWLRQKIFFSVGHGGRGQGYGPGPGGVKASSDDIRLLNDGKVLRDRTRVHPGTTLDFDVVRSVGDRFVRAEAWLLAATETCCVCSDEKTVSEMPQKITASCSHPTMTCKECVGQWISSSLESVAWDRLKCPECPQLLGFEDVRAFATPDTFVR